MQFRIEHLDRIDSTSDELFRRLEAGRAGHGDGITATEQTAGRGRFGRPWHAGAGGGLFLSVAICPREPLPPPALTLAGGLAVLDAVRGLGCVEAALDWPNDLVLHGAKLAGVLVESRGLDPAAQRFVLGIGLNVGQREFPDELRAEREVTSLALAGLDVPLVLARERLLAALELRVEQALTADPRLTAEFIDGTGLRDEQVEVSHAEGQLERGRWTDLDLQRGVQLDGDRWIRLEWIRALGT